MDENEEFEFRLRAEQESAQSRPAANPAKIGADAFPDTLRETLRGASWGERNLAGVGTGLTNLAEGVQQIIKGSELYNLVTKGRFAKSGDSGGLSQQSQADKIIAEEAPIGAIGGAIATALPMMAAGNAPAAVGAVSSIYGAVQPAENESQRALNAAVSGVAGAGGQVVANKAASWMQNKLQSLMADKARNSGRDATLTAAQEAGLVVPPDVVNPSMLNRALTGFAGKLTTQQQASAQNQEIFNAMARRSLGMADDVPLSDESLNAFRASKSGPYRELSAMGDFPVDNAYALGKRGPQVFGATKPQNVFLDGAGNVVPDVPAMPKPEMTRNLVSELVKDGGIARGEMADMGIDAAAKSRPGLFRKEGTGKTADDLVEWMEQNGWLSARDIENANKFDPGGSHDMARTMIKESMEGRPVFHPSEDDLAYQFGDKLSQWGKQYGDLQKTTIPGDPGKVSAADAAEKLKDLRADAKGYWRQYNSGLIGGHPKHRKAAKAYDSAAEQLEQFMERSAANAGKPELVQALREARREIAKAHTVGKALNDATGNVNARTLAREKYVTGDIKTAADFAKAFPKASQPVEGMGSLPGISPLDFASSGILGGAGAIASGDPRGASLALLPFMRPAVRNMILSKAYQGAMANPNYALGAPTQTLGSLLRYSPVGGTVLGLDALQK